MHTSSDSDAVGGQAYRGGKGNDIFNLGSQDTILLASSADNGGNDTFHGNGAATHRIIAEDDGTAIGLSGSYGGSDSVDVIDGGGHAGVIIVGSNAAHNTWDFSGTELIGIAEIRGGDNTASDTITGSDGADTILGLGASDRLGGGEGNDTLWGGLGADAFVFADTGAANLDHVGDYSFAQADRVVVTDVLAGFGAGDAIADFVRLVAGAGDTTVEVDSDGAGGDWTAVAVLDDYLGQVRVQAGAQVFDLI